MGQAWDFRNNSVILTFSSLTCDFSGKGGKCHKIEQHAEKPQKIILETVAGWVFWACSGPNTTLPGFTPGPYSLRSTVKEEEMPKPKKTLKSYLTSEEYAAVSTSARRAKLSVSTFVRRVCLGQEVNSLIDLEAVLLVKNSKADLGRLGGLLKKHLSETGGTEDWHQELRGLLRSIEYSQRKLTKDCEGITRVLHQLRKGKQ